VHRQAFTHTCTLKLRISIIPHSQHNTHTHMHTRSYAYTPYRLHIFHATEQINHKKHIKTIIFQLIIILVNYNSVLW